MKYGGWLLIGAVIVIGVYMKMSNMSETDESIKADIVAFVQDLDCYADNAAALDEMCEIAHDEAFDAAYSIGGRRSSGSLNGEKYINGFVDSMTEQARSRQLDQSVIDEVESLRHQLSYE